jgi:hypothetical protein
MQHFKRDQWVRHLTYGITGRIIRYSVVCDTDILVDTGNTVDYFDQDEWEELSFWNYLFNRHQHGKWSWAAAIWTYALALACLITGIVSGVWLVILFYIVFMGVILYGHYQNFKGKQT